MWQFLRSATVILLLVAGFSHAQTFRGAINGSVVDPSGAVVSSAEVRAINSGTGVTLSTASTNEGQFAFQDLPLGSYKITVNAPGFQSVNVDNVLVTAGSVYTLPVKLTVGQQATAIEVSAAAVAVDTTTATQNMTIPSSVVQNVPLNGDRPTSQPLRPSYLDEHFFTASPSVLDCAVSPGSEAFHRRSHNIV